jgi:ribosome-binding factor A
MEELEKKRKRIQGLVGRGIVLKYTPQLRFILDESIERGNRVLRILDELEKSSRLEPE